MNKPAEWGPLIIRFVLGLIFLVHGLKKVTEMQDTVQHFSVNLGIPAYLTYGVTFIEVVGGAFLILGIFTRTAALGMACIMIGAIFLAKWDKGFIQGYEFDLALLAMSLSLLFKKKNEGEERVQVFSPREMREQFKIVPKDR